MRSLFKNINNLPKRIWYIVNIHIITPHRRPLPPNTGTHRLGTAWGRWRPLAVHKNVKSAAKRKKVDLEGSSEHNFVKWNVGVKMEVTDSLYLTSKWTHCWWPGRVCPRAGRTRPPPLTRRATGRSCRKSCRAKQKRTTPGGQPRGRRRLSLARLGADVSSAQVLKSSVQQIRSSEKCWIKVTGNGIY